MSKRSYSHEFSKTTKQEARNRVDYTCEMCGERITKKGGLHAHHRVSVWASIQLGIPSKMISNIANCSILCPSCHELSHNPEPGLDFYETLAISILGVSQKLL